MDFMYKFPTGETVDLWLVAKSYAERVVVELHRAESVVAKNTKDYVIDQEIIGTVSELVASVFLKLETMTYEEFTEKEYPVIGIGALR